MSTTLNRLKWRTVLDAAGAIKQDRPDWSLDQCVESAMRTLGMRMRSAPTRARLGAVLERYGGTTRLTRSSRGRPNDAFPRSLDAAILFECLRKRGLTWRKAEDAVRTLLGSSPSTLDKYRPDARGAMRDGGKAFAAAAILKHRKKIEKNMAALPASERAALRRVFNELPRTPTRSN